jgi:hypothetical protein
VGRRGLGCVVVAIVASACGGAAAPSATQTSAGPTSTAAALTRTATPAPTAAAATAQPTPRSACALPSSVTWKATEGEYAGPIFDAHLHLFVDRRLVPTNAGSEGLCKFMDKYGFSAALGFYALPAASPPRSNIVVQQAAPLVDGAKARVVPMLEMGTDVPDLFSPTSTFAKGQFTDAVLQGYLEPQWVFKGIGEVPANVWQAPGIDSAPMQTVLRNVNAKKGVIMIHAWEAPIQVDQQRAKAEADIKAAPNVTFLFHGGKAAFDLVEPLMQKYPNVYFSWDGGPGWMVGSWGSLMHPGATPQNPTGTGGSTQQFLSEMAKVGTDRVVSENLAFLTGILQKHPDRITAAMDMNATWHFEDASAELIVKTFRKIVAKLPADLQERYAYKNAMRIFGPFLAQ